VGQGTSKTAGKLRVILAGTVAITLAGCMGNEATRGGFSATKPAATEGMRTTGRFAENVQPVGDGETTGAPGARKALNLSTHC